jgi:Zn-dependent M28 family amino/carboxypeptidase
VRLGSTIAAPASPRVIVGAHYDRCAYPSARGPVLTLPSTNNIPGQPAPGADDNASGVAVLLAALRVLARVSRERGLRRAVEVHFYAAEEAGWLGSMAVARAYRRAGVAVHAMACERAPVSAARAFR